MYGQDNLSGIGDEWVAEHLPLVRYVVARLIPSRELGLDFEDLVSFGLVGLLEAKRRYDPERGAFGSFAVPRIRGAILDALRANDFLPRSIRRDVRKVDAVTRDAAALTGEQLTIAEIGKRTSLPQQKVVDAWNASHLSFVPLEAAGAPDGDERNAAELADSGKTPLEMVVDRELLTELTELVERLPEREKIIVSLHFVEGLTMRQIGAVLSISESRVSQLQTRALQRIRVSLNAA